MTDVLVLGGSGFVGSYVVNRLRQQSGFNTHVLGEGRYSGIRIGESLPLKCALPKDVQFDVVLNLAAHIGDSSEALLAANFHGIHDVLDLCNSGRVGRLIHMSRSFTVNNSDTQQGITRLARMYEYSKYYAELVIKEHSQVPATSLRITAPIWKSMPSARFMSYLLKFAASNAPASIYGRGKRIQNYVRLDDVFDAIKAVIDVAQPSQYQSFMVAGPENFSDFEFAKAVYERLGKPFSYKFVSPDGATIDESDYGIVDRIAHYKSEPALNRVIDSHYLEEHLAFISGNSD